MRFPVKVCLGLPSWFHRLARLTIKGNPRVLVEPEFFSARDGVARRTAFTEGVAVLASGTTWKTTRAGRHMMTDAMIQRSCANRRPVILDLAASDGTTSLDLIEKLGKGFARYYVTDVSFIASCIEDDGRFYFFDRHGECTLVAGRHYLVFSGVNGAIFPFGLIARRILASAPRHNDQRVRKVSLLNPDLRDRAAADPRIVIQEHDMFAPWTGETPEIIKIANVLNRDYFSDAQLSNVLGNLKKTLAAGGRLFVTDNNRDKERVSVFVKVGARMELLEQVNGGAQVTELALAV